MPQIALSAKAERNQGLYAEVDEEDFSALSRFRWHAHRSPRSLTVYAKRQRSRREGGGFIFMHQQVLGIVDGAEIDHRDGDGLNNRRGNLRHLTHAGNMQAFATRRNEAKMDAWLIEQGIDPNAEAER